MTYDQEYASLAHPVDYRAEVERYKTLLAELAAERDGLRGQRDALLAEVSRLRQDGLAAMANDAQALGAY